MSSSSSGKGAPPRIKRFPADECDAGLGEIPCPVYHKGAHRARSSKGGSVPQQDGFCQIRSILLTDKMPCKVSFVKCFQQSSNSVWALLPTAVLPRLGKGITQKTVYKTFFMRHFVT